MKIVLGKHLKKKSQDDSEDDEEYDEDQGSVSDPSSSPSETSDSDSDEHSHKKRNQKKKSKGKNSENHHRPTERARRRRRRARDKVGPWKLGKTLGKGSTGRVRLAKHMESGQLAAIKIVSKKKKRSVNTGSSGILPYGIEREIIIMKLVSHPNIMALYEVWENKSELYLVLEYIDGGELFDYLVSRGKLPEKEAIYYFRQIVQGVSYLHKFNICHRDLKPENLLLDKKNKKIKIADFGMAALELSNQMLDTSCGSPHYASPEIVMGKKYHGSPSDVWSCGIILYALLTGHLPFNDTDVKILLAKVQTGSFDVPSYLSNEAKDLICKMIVVSPKKRIVIDDILEHPLLTKYNRFTMNKSNTNIRMIGSNKQDKKHNEGDEVDNLLSNLPVQPEIVELKSKRNVDPSILENLQILWHGCPKSDIVKKLLRPGKSEEKIFYSLLYQYQENQHKVKELDSANNEINEPGTQYHANPEEDDYNAAFAPKLENNSQFASMNSTVSRNSSLGRSSARVKNFVASSSSSRNLQQKPLSGSSSIRSFRRNTPVDEDRVISPLPLSFMADESVNNTNAFNSYNDNNLRQNGLLRSESKRSLYSSTSISRRSLNLKNYANGQPLDAYKNNVTNGNMSSASTYKDLRNEFSYMCDKILFDERDERNVSDGSIGANVNNQNMAIKSGFQYGNTKVPTTFMNNTSNNYFQTQQQQKYSLDGGISSLDPKYSKGSSFATDNMLSYNNTNNINASSNVITSTPTQYGKMPLNGGEKNVSSIRRRSSLLQQPSGSFKNNSNRYFNMPFKGGVAGGGGAGGGTARMSYMSDYKRRSGLISLPSGMMNTTDTFQDLSKYLNGLDTSDVANENEYDENDNAVFKDSERLIPEQITFSNNNNSSGNIGTGDKLDIEDDEDICLGVGDSFLKAAKGDNITLTPRPTLRRGLSNSDDSQRNAIVTPSNQKQSQQQKNESSFMDTGGNQHSNYRSSYYQSDYDGISEFSYKVPSHLSTAELVNIRRTNQVQNYENNAVPITSTSTTASTTANTNDTNIYNNKMDKLPKNIVSKDFVNYSDYDGIIGTDATLKKLSNSNIKTNNSTNISSAGLTSSSEVSALNVFENLSEDEYEKSCRHNGRHNSERNKIFTSSSRDSYSQSSVDDDSYFVDTNYEQSDGTDSDPVIHRKVVSIESMNNNVILPLYTDIRGSLYVNPQLQQQLPQFETNKDTDGKIQGSMNLSKDSNGKQSPVNSELRKELMKVDVDDEYVYFNYDDTNGNTTTTTTTTTNNNNTNKNIATSTSFNFNKNVNIERENTQSIIAKFHLTPDKNSRFVINNNVNNSSIAVDNIHGITSPASNNTASRRTKTIKNSGIPIRINRANCASEKSLDVNKVFKDLDDEECDESFGKMEPDIFVNDLEIINSNSTDNGFTNTRQQSNCDKEDVLTENKQLTEKNEKDGDGEDHGEDRIRLTMTKNSSVSFSKDLGTVEHKKNENIGDNEKDRKRVTMLFDDEDGKSTVFGNLENHHLKQQRKVLQTAPTTPNVTGTVADTDDAVQTVNSVLHSDTVDYKNMVEAVERKPLRDISHSNNTIKKPTIKIEYKVENVSGSYDLSIGNNNPKKANWFTKMVTRISSGNSSSLHHTNGGNNNSSVKNMPDRNLVLKKIHKTNLSFQELNRLALTQFDLNNVAFKKDTFSKKQKSTEFVKYNCKFIKDKFKFSVEIDHSNFIISKDISGNIKYNNCFNKNDFSSRSIRGINASFDYFNEGIIKALKA
ncbi:uncharacterized protein SCODWIG_02129 [Saccharomycodes ludwigii]|uniref:non-specific serine/threonine protein kinase n=1 Tax=Saccharomycodes ludwigii TaxID=36035 RepID=A0A376B6S3_9ASCO|nr:uncharacterized protein SCODWIG_02129 [Saccharomycodes ludwigii]